MSFIPIERDAEDALLFAGVDGAVYIECRLCAGAARWDHDVSDLRTAAAMWDEHVGAVHS